MRRPPAPLRNNRGFTLVEAMVVVAIVGIFIGFSYSGFQSWQRKERVRAAAYELSGILQEARMLAIEKHTSHTVYISSAGDNWEVHFFRDPVSSGGYFNCVTATAVGQTDANNNMKLRQIISTSRYPGVRIRPGGTVQNIRFDVQGIPHSAGGFGALGFFFENVANTAQNCNLLMSNLGRVNIQCSDNQD